MMFAPHELATLQTTGRDAIQAAATGDCDALALICFYAPETLQLRDEAQQRSLLHLAARGGHTDVARLVLDNNADPVPYLSGSVA